MKLLINYQQNFSPKLGRHSEVTEDFSAFIYKVNNSDPVYNEKLHAFTKPTLDEVEESVQKFIDGYESVQAVDEVEVNREYLTPKST